MAIEKFGLELVESKNITSNVKHFAFKRDDGKKLNFIAGQFITFLFDHEDGKLRRRSYSVASIPSQTDHIEIAISYVKDGIASEHLFNMKAGDSFNAMGPAGRLILKDESIRKLILAGTGTGIAPYRAMLPELATKTDMEIHILLGVQYRQDALYAEDFRAYAKQYPHMHFTACLSRETENLANDEFNGYVQNQFEALNLDPQQDVVYLCGNPHMIDQSFEMLSNAGFDAKNVRREKYISSN